MIGGVDWHLPNLKVTFLRSAFCLVDARCNIFCLEPLKQMGVCKTRTGYLRMADADGKNAENKKREMRMVEKKE